MGVGRGVEGHQIALAYGGAVDRRGDSYHRRRIVDRESDLVGAFETTGVGDRLVLERMREGGFALGGENSGHIIFADHATTGDGIMSALKVLQVMKERGATLAELADCMTEYPQELVNLNVKEKPPVESFEELQTAIGKAEEAFGGKGRTLVRYSGTEPKIRILVECVDAACAKEQADAIAGVVQEAIGV